MDLRQLRKSIEHDDQTYGLLDDTLYRLCRDHPDHTDRGSVYAKLLLIGRGYATGIERQIKSDGTMGGSLTMLAAEMLKQGRELNDLFAELMTIGEPLTVETAEKIVGLHGRFIQLIRKPLRPKRSPKSFASKYMHFHCSAVPIIDSYATLKLKKLVPWKKAKQFDKPKEADPEYAWHVMRFMALYEEAQKLGLPFTVKKLDSFLIAAADV